MRAPLAVVAVATALAVPSGAHAAVVMVPLPDVAVFRAADGETNDVTVKESLGGLTFADAGAPLETRTGCVPGPPATCDTHAAEVLLRDGDDRAMTQLTFADAWVSGGAGDDTIGVSALNAAASGGPGDDRIRLSADTRDEGHGGIGDDVLVVDAGSAVQLFGDDGRDILVGSLSGRPPGAIGEALHGGAGDDILVGAGPGPPTAVAVRAAQFILSGGPGNDWIEGSAGNHVVDAGEGNDVVDVRTAPGGEPDTVACGPGDDVVFADANDTVAADCEHVFVTGADPNEAAVDALVSSALNR
jgi:Ca2+-binding RTX toxin-like protein